MSAKLTRTGSAATREAAAAAAAAVQAASCGSSIAYVQCQNLKYNAIIIGWLGVIISSVMVFSSMMLIHMQTDVDLLIKQLLLSHATEKEQQFLMNCKSTMGIYLLSISLLCVQLYIYLSIHFSVHLSIHSFI